ncbi:MAG: hypothetical protein IKA03_01950, partial [Alphaproteobacteria bacterium]|nr:hypothetical protein [Alphaproteobacteria bacterium]
MRGRRLWFWAYLCAGMIIANVVAAKVWLLPDYSLRQVNSYRVNTPGEHEHDISDPSLRDPENYKCSAYGMKDPNNLSEDTYCAKYYYGLRTCCAEVKCKSDYQYTADACAAEQEGWVPSGVPCTAEEEPLYKACVCSDEFQYIENDNCDLPEASAGFCAAPDGTTHYKECTSCQNGEYTLVANIDKCKVCGSEADSDYCDVAHKYCKNSSITDKTCDDGATCVNGECVVVGRDCIGEGYTITESNLTDIKTMDGNYGPFEATFETCTSGSQNYYKYTENLEFEVLLSANNQIFAFTGSGTAQPPLRVKINDMDVVQSSYANQYASLYQKPYVTLLNNQLILDGNVIGTVSGRYSSSISKDGIYYLIHPTASSATAMKFTMVPSYSDHYKISFSYHVCQTCAPITESAGGGFSLAGSTVQGIRLLNLNLPYLRLIGTGISGIGCSEDANVQRALLGYIPNLPPRLGAAFNAFRACTNLEGPVPSLPNGITNGDYMFAGTKISDNIQTLPTSLTSGSAMFANTNISGTVPPLPEGLTSAASMFLNTDVSGSVPSLPAGLKSASSMFKNTKVSGSIPKLPSGLTTADNMFSETLVSGNIPNLPSSLTSASGMFANCSNLSGVLPDLPSGLTTADMMFYGCSGLEDTLTSLPDTITSAAQMFHGATNISANCLAKPAGITGPLEDANDYMTDFGEGSQIVLAYDWTEVASDCGNDGQCTQIPYGDACYDACGDGAVTEDEKMAYREYVTCYDTGSNSLKYQAGDCIDGYTDVEGVCYKGCGCLNKNIYDSTSLLPLGTIYDQCATSTGTIKY